MKNYSLLLLLSILYSAASYAEFNHQPLAGEAYRLTDEAYQAMAKHDDARAESLVREARGQAGDSYQLAMLLLDIQMRRGEWADAQTLSDELRLSLPNDALLLVNSGFIATQQQRPDAAREFFKAALTQPGLDAAQQENVRLALASLNVPVADKPVAVMVGESPLDAAYRHLNAHQEALSVEKFQQGFALKTGTANQYADAAYTAKKIHLNAQAISWLQQALAANEAMPEGLHAFTPQQAFSYSREIQMLQREWGVVGSLSYQHNALTSTSKLNTLAGGAEVYWQPNDFVGNQDGHLFQLFAGGSETLYDANGGATGAITAQTTVGLRYKPFSSLGIVLVAQRVFPMGIFGTTDTLLHIAYSDAVGTELNVQDKQWRTWQYFADAAYFVQAHRSYNSFEANYGQVFQHETVGGKLLWTPHGVFAAEYDSTALKPLALYVGPGIKLRYWFHEEAYSAPASWAELNLQYRYELTNTSRSRGVLMRAIVWY